MVAENPEKLGGIRTELSSQTKAPEAAGAIDNQVAKGGEIQPGVMRLLILQMRSLVKTLKLHS